MEEHSLLPNSSILNEVERELSSNKIFADPSKILSSVCSFKIKGAEAALPSYSLLRKSLLSQNNSTINMLIESPSMRHLLNETIVDQLGQGSKNDETLKTNSDKLDRLFNEENDSDFDSIIVHSQKLNVHLGHESSTIEGRIFKELFEEHIKNNVSSLEVTLATPRKKNLETLREAMDVAFRTVPLLYESLLPHVGCLAIIDYSELDLRKGETRPNLCQNVSSHAVPGTIFLSPSPLRTKLDAAEALIHESAHKKLSDLVLTKDVFKENYDIESAFSVEAIWNRSFTWNDSNWTTDRALFAFHVYVYLALFYGKRLLLDNDTPQQRFFNAARKAHFLYQKIKNNCTKDLGAYGCKLLEWLYEQLIKLSEPEENQNLTILLMMDKYDRETIEIDALFKRARNLPIDLGNWEEDAPYDEWAVKRSLLHLLHSEIVSSYRVLHALGNSDNSKLPHYDGDRWCSINWSAYSYDSLIVTLFSVRNFLSSTIRGIEPKKVPAKVVTTREKPLVLIVEEIVEHAYRHLPIIKQGINELRNEVESQPK